MDAYTEVTEYEEIGESYNATKNDTDVELYDCNAGIELYDRAGDLNGAELSVDGPGFSVDVELYERAIDSDGAELNVNRPGLSVDAELYERTDEAAAFTSFDERMSDGGSAESRDMEVGQSVEPDDTELPSETAYKTEADEMQEVDFAELQEALDSINPNYDPFALEDSPYNNNCGSCAAAVYDYLEGNELHPASDTTLTIEEMEQHTGFTQVEATPEEIEQHVLGLGAGGHVVVGVDFAEGPGHWFNAYTPDGKNVYYVDGQDATISAWPPDYIGDATHCDMSKREEKHNG